MFFNEKAQINQAEKIWKPLSSVPFEKPQISFSNSKQRQHHFVRPHQVAYYTDKSHVITPPLSLFKILKQPSKAEWLRNHDRAQR